MLWCYPCNYGTRLICTGVLKVRHPCLTRAFHELFGLLEKQKGSCWHIRCDTFNTWANRVAVICSVITKIFNPMQMLDSHISTFFNWHLWLFVLVHRCPSPVTAIRLLFNLLFYCAVPSFIFWFWNCIPGISILLNINHHQAVNKHHTADCTVFVLV
jgi:hypothetical protein